MEFVILLFFLNPCFLPWWILRAEFLRVILIPRNVRYRLSEPQFLETTLTLVLLVPEIIAKKRLPVFFLKHMSCRWQRFGIPKMTRSAFPNREVAFGEAAIWPQLEDSCLAKLCHDATKDEVLRCKSGLQYALVITIGLFSYYPVVYCRVRQLVNDRHSEVYNHPLY